MPINESEMSVLFFGIFIAGHGTDGSVMNYLVLQVDAGTLEPGKH
jgi:hypothetical protein